MANNTPAATAEPMTPATLGPMACINKKLLEFASNPTLLETLAAMGTAETPAEPISGLMGVDESLFMIFAKMIPDAVPIQNATKPNNKIPMVSTVKKYLAASLEPTARPSKMVTMLMISKPE